MRRPQNPLRQAGAAPAWPAVPAGVEVMTRRSGVRTVAVVVNWRVTVQVVPIPNPARDVLTGGAVRTLSLQPFGVAVVEARR